MDAHMANNYQYVPITPYSANFIITTYLSTAELNKVVNSLIDGWAPESEPDDNGHLLNGGGF
jgi:hypothetical protein